MKTIAWMEYFSKFNILKHPAREASFSSDAKPVFRQTAPSPGHTEGALIQQKFSPKVRKDVNYLASTLVVEGSVVSESDIVIEGLIRGNVTCRGNIEILGEIKGDVCGKSIRVSQGKITGNIRADEGVYIYNSRVTGDIVAESGEIDSAINGNLTISGSLVIRKASVIKGNITASALSIEENALLEGKVVVSQTTPSASQAETPELQQIVLEMES